MADNKIANAIKFLKGEEKSLPATKTEGQVYFAYKNVGTAEKPSYTGAIYIDTPIGGTQNRIKMTANADIADKAFNDSAGLNIRDTYVSSLGYTDDGKQTILIKGSGNNQIRIALPIASTTKSGIITTDTQSFNGTKTFTTIDSTNLTVTGSNGFNYSSISAGTADVARPVWFADNSGNGKPVVNTNFTYNPATQTLSVANLSGTADKANKDSAGNDIRNTYISNITVNGTTLTFTKGGGATSSITLQDNNNAVIQTAIKSSDYTNWRTVLWGASNSATEGFTPTTVTDGAFTSDTLTFQPSSGTLKAKIFKGNLSGNASSATNAATATKLQTARTISLTGSVTGSGTFDGSGNLSIITTTNHSHNQYLPLSGGTLSGTLAAPNITASNYFTTPSIVGEGDLSTYYHRVDFGRSGVNQFDFYEYGGIYNFYKNQSTGKDKAVMLGRITSNGWEGNVIGNLSGNATTATALTTSAGSSTQPVYFSGGKPVICTYTLNKSVPADAKFTDTWRPLGTTGDTACAGNDSRLSNARPASDVYAWAKASTKPVYTWDEITNKPSTFAPAPHTHNYAGSSSAGGAATSANLLNKNSSFLDSYTGSFSYYDADISNTTNNSSWSSPSSGWHQIYHNDLSVANYWTELAFPINDINGLAWRQRRNSEYFGWYRILDSNNYTSYTVNKDGSGASGTWSINVTGSAGSVAWGNVSGKPSTFTPASHTHPYLPLSGGTMTGTINFRSDKLACNFILESSGYRTGIMHQTYGSEALVFATTSAFTSFIFKCGQDPTSMKSNTWANITPSMQIKQQSVYINSLINNTVTPNYNLYVNGTTRCNGTLGVGNGSSAEIDFFPKDYSTIKAKIVAYDDRIEFVFA